MKRDTGQMYELTIHDSNAEVVKRVRLPEGESLTISKRDYDDLQEMLEWWRKGKP